MAAGIVQPGFGIAEGLVLPKAQDVAQAHVRCEIVGELELGVILQGIRLAGGAEQVPGLPTRVLAGDLAIYRHAASIAAGRGEQIGVSDGMRLAVETLQRQPQRQIADAIADGCAEGAGRIVAVRPVELEILDVVTGFRMRLETLGHARHVIDDGADRIAGIGRRERAVQHVHALDFLRRHQAPTRREAGAVAEKIRQGDAVGIDQRTRAVAGAGGARGQYGMVVIADVTFAHQQAGEVLQGILGVGGVDPGFDLLAADAFHRGRDLGRQRSRLRADDLDGAEVLGFARWRGIGRRFGSGSRESGQRKGNGEKQPRARRGRGRMAGHVELRFTRRAPRTARRSGGSCFRVRAADLANRGRRDNGTSNDAWARNARAARAAPPATAGPAAGRRPRRH